MYYLLSIIVEDFQLNYPAIPVQGGLLKTNHALNSVVEKGLSNKGIDTDYKWYKSGKDENASISAKKTFQLRTSEYGDKFCINKVIKGNDKITTPFYRALYNRPTKNVIVYKLVLTYGLYYIVIIINFGYNIIQYRVFLLKNLLN